MHSLAAMLGRQALVLKKFEINQNGEEFVHIVARKAGLLSWLLTLIGVDATTEFQVFSNRIEFREGSLSGQIQTVLPLRSISIATCGYLKPVILLVMAIVFLAGMIAVISNSGALAVLFLICSFVCFIFYFLHKNMLISVVSNSSWPIMICFKRSVIEGVKVEYEQARQVIGIINNLLMNEASK